MDIITLTFNGPVKMKAFSETCPPNSEHPGVYIWGFMQQDKFIPYYVGKSQSKVVSRIQQHYKNIMKPDSTYIRLNKCYMEGENPYYLDEKYPLITSAPNRDKLPSWIYDNKCDNREYFKNRIDYINNKEFYKLKGILLDSAKTNHAINEIGVKIEDYLVDNIDRLFVMYAAYSSNEFFGFKRNALFEILEAFTKFYLKGRTGSKSLSLGNMVAKIEASKLIIKIDNLDGYRCIFKDEPSDDIFPGY